MNNINNQNTEPNIPLEKFTDTAQARRAITKALQNAPIEPQMHPTDKKNNQGFYYCI